MTRFKMIDSSCTRLVPKVSTHNSPEEDTVISGVKVISGFLEEAHLAAAEQTAAYVREAGGAP